MFVEEPGKPRLLPGTPLPPVFLHFATVGYKNIVLAHKLSYNEL